VVSLADNLHMLEMGSAGNVLALTGPEGVLLIDDQFAPMVPRIRAALNDLGATELVYLFNTHWHGDHTGGNQGFGELGMTIVAHDNVRKRLSEEQFHLLFKARSAPRPPEALPVITFNDRMTFYFNNEIIDVVHVPDAHTDGDAIYYFRNADVMHTGDAFINRGFPLIDVASGGTVKGQIEATQTMIDLAGPDTVIVSGHGPLADRDRLIVVRDMLITARANVVALIEEGKTLREIKDAEPLQELDPQWSLGFLKARAFVTIIYQAETGDWEKPANMPLVE
ncbi:MAG: MBL fold metallo-hydrolase, partial [Gammaproteobacteria bacterium]